MKTITTMFLALTLAGPLAAQGWIETLPDRPGGGVVKVRTDVSVVVIGRVAHVEVEEFFRNDGGRLGEGDYIYPLPGEAVFSNFSLFQGDEELRGETMDAQRARAIYEEIVRKKKDPALIELVGHGLVRARVFPIQSGETRKITLRYTQMLDRAGEALRFQYAAGGATRWQVGENGQTSMRATASTVPLAFTLRANQADRYADPFSPTHDVVIRRAGDQLVVKPAGDLQGDFALFLPLTTDDVGITVASHRIGDEDGYVMLTLSPGQVGGAITPRDITVVLDVSGSMSGSKLNQAKDAMHQMMGSLGPHDRFRLLAFSNSIRPFRRSWSVPAEDASAALEWIDGLVADGGTNIEGALREAFATESEPEHLPIVVFVTDGLPSVGEENPEILAQTADERRGRTRVFAFGVGHDVNTYLLDRLSETGRGATEYVEPGSDVEQALSLLTNKIQHPMLTDIDIADTPVELYDLYPITLPDLFFGEELVVFARYRPGREATTGDVGIAGRRNGQRERFSAGVSFPVDEPGNDFIPQLWAARKIGYLSREIRLRGQNAELVEEIKRTALRYGLLSEYTSYLVLEPEAIAVGGVVRSVVSNAPPASAPSEATGAGAVAVAKQSAARRQARSAGDLRDVDSAFAQSIEDDTRRVVGGRIFTFADETWTDATTTMPGPVVRIVPFSKAYFAVLQALPELEAFFAEFDDVVIGGEELAIALDADGKDTLDDGQIARLVRGFRGD